MRNFEDETGKKAIWRSKITESYKRWQKGEKNYNINRERIALYVPEGIKKEWIAFAKNNDYPTLSKLIRDSMKFFIEYKLNIIDMNKNIEINLLSHLSHDLKEPLTTIKAYSQLILENYESLSKNNMREMVNKIFKQSLDLETFIIQKIDKSRENEEKNMNV
ncbi:MAG: histidine kinase dimerization/phospho-acceptor domain-containing protein, partial [Candidatus Odinarchaeota archaeon]